MESLYSGMSVGFGFLLFCTLLSFIWILFQNYKKRLLPQNRSFDIADLVDYQAEEERKEQRVVIRWPVSIKTVIRNIRAETKELNRSGAFIKCREPLLPGEEFYLFIETPYKGVILLKSKVVWSNCNTPEEKVVTRGMGIRFIQNKKEDLIKLESAIDEYIESIGRTFKRAMDQRVFI